MAADKTCASCNNYLHKMCKLITGLNIASGQKYIFYYCLSKIYPGKVLPVKIFIIATTAYTSHGTQHIHIETYTDAGMAIAIAVP